MLSALSHFPMISRHSLTDKIALRTKRFHCSTLSLSDPLPLSPGTNCWGIVRKWWGSLSQMPWSTREHAVWREFLWPTRDHGKLREWKPAKVRKWSGLHQSWAAEGGRSLALSISHAPTDERALRFERIRVWGEVKGGRSLRRSGHLSSYNATLSRIWLALCRYPWDIIIYVAGPDCCYCSIHQQCKLAYFLLFILFSQRSVAWPVTFWLCINLNILFGFQGFPDCHRFSLPFQKIKTNNILKKHHSLYFHLLVKPNRSHSDSTFSIISSLLKQITGLSWGVSLLL